MSLLSSVFESRWANHPLLRRYTAVMHADLSATFSRDIQKWLLIAPIIGIATGIVVSIIAELLLNLTWARVLPFYLTHHWAIVPGVLVGALIAGVIMRYRTPDPNLHSTEEIIRSYHEYQGDIDIKPFWWKLLAAIINVGSGGSAALEGPGIYAGGALGSWLWTRLKRFGLEPRDRRLMLICGAAAGMAAVFRAPLTGIVFALEMPYKDDLAHEALLPALIASVVSFGTLASILGSEPLFGFAGSTTFTPIDLAWSALLGLGCGVITMVFTITFRRFRGLMIHSPMPHVTKMAIGGALTGICGLIFITVYPGELIPIGPNYEAVRLVLTKPHPSLELLWFAIFKLAATLFTLGVGGVSAMFVPLFLSGGALGSAFAQSIVHTPVFDLYAAVGMASFLAAGYKAPLTAVVFVAEVTGGHSFIVPSLIGAACAYAISGESSASGDQRLHEVVRLSGVSGIAVREVMQRQVAMVQASATLRNFAEGLAAHYRHALFPVSAEGKTVGVIAVWTLTRVPARRWDQVKVGDICDRAVTRISAGSDLLEALRLLSRESQQQMLLVTAADGALEGIVTKTDILRAFQPHARRHAS